MKHNFIKRVQNHGFIYCVSFIMDSYWLIGWFFKKWQTNACVTTDTGVVRSSGTVFFPGFIPSL